MKPYSLSGLLLVFCAALLAFYSLATWSHRFAYPIAARLEKHAVYLATGKTGRPQAKPLIGLMQPRYVRVVLPERG